MKHSLRSKYMAPAPSLSKILRKMARIFKLAGHTDNRLLVSLDVEAGNVENRKMRTEAVYWTCKRDLTVHRGQAISRYLLLLQSRRDGRKTAQGAAT